jgi:hypothetical protein
MNSQMRLARDERGFTGPLPRIASRFNASCLDRLPLPSDPRYWALNRTHYFLSYAWGAKGGPPRFSFPLPTKDMTTASHNPLTFVPSHCLTSTHFFLGRDIGAWLIDDGRGVQFSSSSPLSYHTLLLQTRRTSMDLPKTEGKNSACRPR